MSSNQQNTNADKTQLIWLGMREQWDKLTTTKLQLLSATVRLSTTVSDIGVLINIQLNTVDHVAALSRACLLHSSQIQLERSALRISKGAHIHIH